MLQCVQGFVFNLTGIWKNEYIDVLIVVKNTLCTYFLPIAFNDNNNNVQNKTNKQSNKLINIDVLIKDNICILSGHK